MALVGGWATAILRSVRVDLAFLGTDGFAGLAGPSCASYEEAQFKDEARRASGRTMILADHSKFAQPGLFQFCTWPETSALVTDATAEATQIGRHTQVITAPASETPASVGD